MECFKPNRFTRKSQGVTDYYFVVHLFYKKFFK